MPWFRVSRSPCMGTSGNASISPARCYFRWVTGAATRRPPLFQQTLRLRSRLVCVTPARCAPAVALHQRSEYQQLRRVCAVWFDQTPGEGLLFCCLRWGLSETGLSLTRAHSLSVLFFPSRTQSKDNRRALWKALFASGSDHAAIRLSSTLWPPCFLFFLNLSLSFSLLGLFSQCGEMAPGKLWSYSGNLCQCGSHRGIYLSPD